MNYGQSINCIWLSFVITWCLVYTVYPNRLETDQGSAFTSDHWRLLADTNGVQLRLSGIETHSFLGAPKRYQESLRRIYRKIRFTHSSVPLPYFLKITIHAMNDTMEGNGPVPSRLVFGIIPRFRILNTELTYQKERMEGLKTAQAEMNLITAKHRILEALPKNIPPAADRIINWGRNYLFARKKK